MIEVKHGVVCLKLKKAVAEEHIEEATAWLKDCAQKIHEHLLKEIDEAMKNLWGNLRLEDPTGEIYGRGPKDLTSTDINSELTSVDSKSKRKVVSCCPFHEEKTPSFYIDIKENRYKCLSCGVQGKVTELYEDLAKC